MYTTVEGVKLLLPPYIQVGDSNIGVPSPGRSDVKRSNFTPDQIIEYIKLGKQEIDSRLRQFYICPLRRIKTYETDITQNVVAGTNVVCWVWDTGAFSKGDTCRIQNGDTMELVSISSIVNEQRMILSSVIGNYNMDSSKISIVNFPDPIPLINARLAVGIGFDILFSAQQAPDISEYGKEQKRLALNSLDSVLSGTVLLTGQEHTGKRFIRTSLYDSFDTASNPPNDFQFGREK